jgi:hypothetical protein
MVPRWLTAFAIRELTVNVAATASHRCQAEADAD